jgi:hypothetical protein
MRTWVVVFVSLWAASLAYADPTSPTPCVNRAKDGWRELRDTVVDANSLRFCTGDDCWSMDLASSKIASITTIPATKPKHDATGELTDASGSVIATASETHVSFCPSGASSCKAFDYKLANPAVNGVYPTMNDERTLGAVMARGESEAHAPSYALMFDLTTAKLIQKVKADDVTVLGHGFLIDDVLYSARMKKLGKLAVPDQGWDRIGTTDLLALHDRQRGALVIQDSSTAKVVAKIALQLPDPKTWFTIIPSTDSKQLYVIANQSDEGEVIVVDVASGKVTQRTSPPLCVNGTRRY